MEEKRIYVVVAATVWTAEKSVVQQPAGRQIAQACHAVSKLRYSFDRTKPEFEPMTTIILQARDSNELRHVYMLALKKKLHVATFEDTNLQAYGVGEWQTAVAFIATKDQNFMIADYLPLWSGK